MTYVPERPVLWADISDKPPEIEPKALDDRIAARFAEKLPEIDARIAAKLPKSAPLGDENPKV